MGAGESALLYLSTNGARQLISKIQSFLASDTGITRERLYVLERQNDIVLLAAPSLVRSFVLSET